MSQDAAMARPPPSAGFHDAVIGLAGAPAALPVVARLALDARARLDVGAGAEHLARAGQHGDPHLIAVADGVERPHQLVQHLHAVRVDRRVVDGDQRDVAVDEFGLDELRFHDLSPRLRRFIPASDLAPSCMIGTLAARLWNEKRS